MPTEPDPADASPGMPPVVATSSDAAAVLYRAAVAATRAFGHHVLAMADLIEEQPHNDDALLAADARGSELHTRMGVACKKFITCRDVLGRIQ